MHILKAPDTMSWEQSNVPSVFLAGGISNCHDWQAYTTDEFSKLWKDKNYVLINPRRDNFDTSDISMSDRQIEWEFEYLQKVDIVMFWFPPETLCPITLFELGSALSRTEYQRIIVGTDPNYQRKFDIKKQLSLYTKCGGRTSIPRYPILLTENLDEAIELTDEAMQRVYNGY